jgi:hypothetical protein
MEAYLPLFGRDAELCGIPDNFPALGFTWSRGPRPHGSHRTGLAIRTRRPCGPDCAIRAILPHAARFTALTLSGRVRRACHGPVSLTPGRPRAVRRGNDRRDGGLARGAGDVLE